MNKVSSVIIIICCLISGGIQASTLLQVKNGKSIVRLTEEFKGALANCELDRIKQTVIRGNGSLDFKVIGGVLDPNEVIGEVNHNGGIVLTCESIGTGSVISVQNLTLELMEKSPVITAVVTVDDTVNGRLPFLIPGGDQLKVEKSKGGGFIKLLNADLTLHPDASMLLMDVFGIFVGDDVSVGRSWSRINLWKSQEQKDDVDDVEREEKEKKEKKEKDEEEEEDDDDKEDD